MLINLRYGADQIRRRLKEKYRLKTLYSSGRKIGAVLLLIIAINLMVIIKISYIL